MSRSAMLMNLPLAVAFLVLALSISPSSSAPVYALTASDISAMESSITTAFGLSASYANPAVLLSSPPEEITFRSCFCTLPFLNPPS